MCRRVTHCLHVLFILSSMDTHFTVVVAKSSLWSNSYLIRQDGWNGARFQMTSTSLVENNQLPIFSRSVAIRTFTHNVRRMEVVVALSSF